MSHIKGLPHFICCCCLVCAVHWIVICRCRTERGCPSLSTIAVCCAQFAGWSSAGVTQKGATPLYLLLQFAVCRSLDGHLQVSHRNGLPNFTYFCWLLCAGRWTVVCRCRTERGCPTSSTVACGGGPIYKITRSSAPLSAVSSHFISSWIECASTPTTTRVSRRQVRTIFLLLLL